jgi:MFS family permease
VLKLDSWRLIFFINVPVGVAAMLLVARIAPSPHRRVPFDWFGQATAVLVMGALTYGAIEAGAAGFSAPRVLAAFVLATAGSIAFLVTERRARHPMVPLGLFRSRNVSVSVAVGFAFVVGYYGLPFVMSLYLQQLRGLSSFAAGAAFVPMMVTGAILTPFSARLAERLSARAVITAGLAVMAAGLAVIAVVPASSPVWALAALMVLVGLGGPLVILRSPPCCSTASPTTRRAPRVGCSTPAARSAAPWPSPYSAPWYRGRKDWCTVCVSAC